MGPRWEHENMHSMETCALRMKAEVVWLSLKVFAATIARNRAPFRGTASVCWTKCAEHAHARDTVPWTVWSEHPMIIFISEIKQQTTSNQTSADRAPSCKLFNKLRLSKDWFPKILSQDPVNQPHRKTARSLEYKSNCKISLTIYRRVQFFFYSLEPYGNLSVAKLHFLIFTKRFEKWRWRWHCWFLTPSRNTCRGTTRACVQCRV